MRHRVEPLQGGPSVGAEGRAAIERLFTLAHRQGLIEAVPPIDPV